jgi:hypothetical protein
MRSTLRIACLILLPVLLLGCAPAPGGEPQSAVPGESFVLVPAESARIVAPGVELVIQFSGVTNDSRCPSDVLCAQAGEALVALRVTLEGEEQTISLSTFGTSASQAQIDGFTIQLVSLEPYPLSTTTIDPQDYLLTLVVETR